MRLIDADAEKEKRMAEIRKCEERIAEYKGLNEPDNAKINHRIEMQRANIRDLKMEIHTLEECSIAYDIGEVVEQLENEIQLIVTQYPVHGKYIKKSRAIEIVKAGEKK